MAVTLDSMTGNRVGAGRLMGRFQPDVVEEIRIMAEDTQAVCGERLAPPARRPSLFARMLRRMLTGAAHH